jgi:hypothetical protein
VPGVPSREDFNGYMQGSEFDDYVEWLATA